MAVVMQAGLDSEVSGVQLFEEATKNTPSVRDMFQQISERASESKFGQWFTQTAMPAMQTAFNNGKNALTGYLNTVQSEAEARGDASFVGRLQVIGQDALNTGRNFMTNLPEYAARFKENAIGNLNNIKDFYIGIGDKLGINDYINQVAQRVREQDYTENIISDRLENRFGNVRDIVDSGLYGLRSQVHGAEVGSSSVEQSSAQSLRDIISGDRSGVPSIWESIRSNGVFAQTSAKESGRDIKSIFDSIRNADLSQDGLTKLPYDSRKGEPKLDARPYYPDRDAAGMVQLGRRNREVPAEFADLIKGDQSNPSMDMDQLS